MSKTTRLTQQDLQIYPSQRMTDTPDGGGRMVGQPLKGEDNEIFPIVSDVDRTMGSFDARLLYPLLDDEAARQGALRFGLGGFHPIKLVGPAHILRQGDFGAVVFAAQPPVLVAHDAVYRVTVDSDMVGSGGFGGGRKECSKAA